MSFAAYLAAAEGACVVDGRVAHFGDARAEAIRITSVPCKTVLLDQGIVAITGADARDFMQAQFTSDCRALDAGHPQLSAWCSPQGRVLFVFRIAADAHGFKVFLPLGEVARLIKRLSAYVLRAAVTIADISTDWTVFGVSAGVAGTPAEPLDWPAEDLPWCTLRLAGPTPRALVYGPTADAERAWRSCPYAAIGADAWQRMDIESGFPVITLATADQFLPQHLNLDLLGAVSNTKGCYPGQEVITRVRTRAAIKRRTVIARAASSARTPTPGTPIYRPGHTPAAGWVLDAVDNPPAGMTMLAVADLEAIDARQARLGTPDGPPVALTRPAYLQA